MPKHSEKLSEASLITIYEGPITEHERWEIERCRTTGDPWAGNYIIDCEYFESVVNGLSVKIKGIPV